MESAHAYGQMTSHWFSAGQRHDKAGDRNGRLLHGYLHKTSNSLCGIKGYASLIVTDQAPDPKTARWARKILCEVETMERIYRSIQDMAFPRRSEPTGIELGLVITRSADVCLRQYGNLTLDIEVQATGRLLLPVRDLELVVAELLRNSAEGRLAEELPDRVRVGIRTSVGESGRIVLVVQDDGPGMPVDMVPQAAVPFVTTKPGHLGIGLARVDTLMDMYGLAWSLQSSPRRGTIVVLDVADRIEADHGTPMQRDRWRKGNDGKETHHPCCR